MKYTPLTEDEKERIVQLKDDGYNFSEIGKMIGRYRSVVSKWYEIEHVKPSHHLDESPYPRYDNPIEDEGDALILPDPEIPFHHAEFINRCIDLAIKWGVTHLIVPGDLVHFASMSGWAPSWEADDANDISDNAEKALMALANSFPQKYRQPLIDALVGFSCVTEKGLSAELSEARTQLQNLTSAFKTATLDMGNHEGRALTTMNNPLATDDLKNLLGIGAWKSAPYYYSILHTERGDFRLTHPKAYSDPTPVKLCAQFHTNVLVAHSHKVIQAFDASGKYYAWHIGCGVDEARLAYVGQRDKGGQLTPHVRGAVLIRGGYPWMLTEYVDWKRLEAL